MEAKASPVRADNPENYIMGNSLIPKGGNDRIYTPDYLADQIVRHFEPSGRILEPARGGGAFFRAIKAYTGREPDWCEVDPAVLPPGEAPRDFLWLDLHNRYDWIITNPPYSILLAFLKKALELSDNVLFLCGATVPGWTSKARAVYGAGFGLREIYRVPTPDEWLKKNGGPGKFGYGLAAIHWQRDWKSQMCLIGGGEGWQAGLHVRPPLPQGDPAEIARAEFTGRFLDIASLQEGMAWDEIPKEKKLAYLEGSDAAWESVSSVGVEDSISLVPVLVQFWDATRQRPSAKPLEPEPW